MVTYQRVKHKRNVLTFAPHSPEGRLTWWRAGGLVYILSDWVTPTTLGKGKAQTAVTGWTELSILLCTTLHPIVGFLVLSTATLQPHILFSGKPILSWLIIGC